MNVYVMLIILLVKSSQVILLNILFIELNDCCDSRLLFVFVFVFVFNLINVVIIFNNCYFYDLLKIIYYLLVMSDVYNVLINLANS